MDTWPSAPCELKTSIESENMTFDQLFRAEPPIIPNRGVHLDLKGLPPTADRFVALLHLFAAARYNVVLIEWEDSFPWTVDQRFRSPTAYTPDDIRRFQKTAADLGLDLIPLVQCLGHMQTPLKTPGYEQLRECPDDFSGLNPLAPGARNLIQKMVEDVLSIMPEVTYFHLGGDEAWTFGQHPDTKAYLDKHGKEALYLQHVEPILDRLNDRNIRSLLWHDMMIDWHSQALKSLATKCDLMTWGYSAPPDTTDHLRRTKNIQRFHDHGINLWGATAYKGADGPNVDRPNIPDRQINALAWTEIAQRYNYVGVIATGWSRYATEYLQCDPIDAALDSLVNTAVILHDGQAPAGGIDACLAALEELGERKRFEACKTSMDHLTGIRRRAWREIQSCREQLTLCRLDPSRCSPRRIPECIRCLAEIIQQAEPIEEQVRQSFAKLVDPIWIEEYLATRLTPLREELSALRAQANA